MDYYFGGIGKDQSWGLASDSPIVVYRKDSAEFVSVASLAEAQQKISTDEDIIYVWQEGLWQKAAFIVLSGQATKSIGFKHD